MLKWTVMSRRDSTSCDRPSGNCQKSATPRQKAKRRRSSVSRRTSTGQQRRCSLNGLEADKENQFHSTPIKSNASSSETFSPFRDLSNLTPRKCKSEKFSPKFKMKKKKRCVASHRRDDESDAFFKPFEAVDSHIESFLASDQDKRCKCNKKTDDRNRPSDAVEEAQPPSKRTRIDTIEDLIGATETESLPGYRKQLQKKVVGNSPVTVSPLVKQFLDLQFSRVSLNRDKNSSSFINDMSLDKLVDALIDRSATSSGTDNTSTSTKTTHNPAPSEASSDSGFRSSTDHQMINNFSCKCSNNVQQQQRPSDDITIVQTYSERYVDGVSRKRSPITPTVLLDGSEAKRPRNEEQDCTLKRQKCVRRRKAERLRKKLTELNGSTVEARTVSPFWSSRKKFDCGSEDSEGESAAGFGVESTPLRGCYLENKSIRETPKVVESVRGRRKCLVFESPLVASDCSSFADSTVRNAVPEIRGSLDLRIFATDSHIYVNVIRGRDLYRGDGEVVNPYVKVAIADRPLASGGSASSRTRTDNTNKNQKKKNAVLQRTAVQSNSSRPTFNHTFKFARLPATEASRKRVHLEVWHRDRNTMTSEFLGCMSFGLEDACHEKVIEGSYRLLSYPDGRFTNGLINPDLHHAPEMGENAQEACCGESVVIEEVLSADGVETELKRSTNKAILSEQQKYADEHLFLRYLELDPIEGPDAIPAAMQRKATGNKSGRTPFTQTKRLVRPAKSGFGFSVVWTHPPRIERVERGLPAERAGILPGDYIIFVDKHNVVMMPEIDILNLIRSYGSQLTLEIFRRNPSRNGSVPSVHQKSTTIVTPNSIRTDSNVNLPSCATTAPTLRRPSTVCSTNTTSIDFRRRKLNLPQVTFSSEKTSTSPEESRKRAIHQLIAKEQQYATALQFAVTRFVSALAERRDLITAAEHKTLFQNVEEILRLTEELLDHLVHEDGEMDTAMLVKVYRCKLHEITSAYKKYCFGIKKADCVLANKAKNSGSDFVRFIQSPAIPRRRPDLTGFIHKPLEHYREVLKLLMAVQNHTPPKHEDYHVINQIVHEMQVAYREITSEAGLMEPCGEGRPLLSVQDLESRLVFTKCKPFVLNKPGRQWIFGGDLSRVEGRNVRQYWTLLFSDLLLFAKASRDRVLFISEEPLPLAHITDMFFNIRKKDTEFRICVNADAQKDASSPTVHCGPDLTRTPRKNSGKKTVTLRAPTTELKAVWQNLLQRQIFQLNSGTDGSSLGSPMDSPLDVPIHSSVGTLQSMETSSFRHRQSDTLATHSDNANGQPSSGGRDEMKKQLETLIEHKCKQMGKTSFNGKCNAIHLEQWMKGQLDNAGPVSPVYDKMEEMWSEEMLRKRSEELQLVDCKGNIAHVNLEPKRMENISGELMTSDHDEQSPSKSTTTESQITVRSSPIVPETVPVCRQCHKNCLSNVLANANQSPTTNHKDCSTTNNNNHYNVPQEEVQKVEENNDWQAFFLFGICTTPVSNLVQCDPFKVQVPAPKISVAPPTPENSVNSGDGERSCAENMALSNGSCTTVVDCRYDQDVSPDDSPQTEEPPYHSLNSSVITLRRFGTVSSLERFGSEERDDVYQNHYSSEGSDLDDDDDDDDDDEDADDELGIDNEAFNHASVMSWTARAGNYVAEKMAFFEKLGEDYRSGGSFFDRYLKTSTVINVNGGEEAQEEETSGATSGEEVWGTPTSGDPDDPLNSPNSPSNDGKLSPNNESYSSDNPDDTELMMDELLMAPPITGAVLRGLLPRRTLEPLIEEDFSDTSSSNGSSIPSSSPTSDPASPRSSSEQDKGSGTSVADTCSRDVAVRASNDRTRRRSVATSTSTSTSSSSQKHARRSCPTTTSQSAPSEWGEEVQKECEDEKQCCNVANDSASSVQVVWPSMPRSESYRKIVEAAEDAIRVPDTSTNPDNDAILNVSDPVLLFDNFRPHCKFANIERASRSRSVRIFEFFNVRRPERRVHEKYPESGRVVTIEFGINSGVPDATGSPSKGSPKNNRNGRFWRQLSRRRSIDRATNPT